MALVADVGRNWASVAPEAPEVIAKPMSGSTIQATPTADEQRGHLVGDQDADAEADERPQAEHEQAERQGPHDRPGGKASCPRRVSTMAPTATEPTRRDQAVDRADAEQRDDLGQHRPRAGGAWRGRCW